MSKRDYYEVLGVPKSATKKEIKRAYRKLAKEFHPDRNKDSGAEDKFKEAQEAYDVLNDDQKRAAYDQYGHAATEGFGAGGGFGGFSEQFGDFGNLGDLLGGLFGGSFEGFGGGSSRRSRGASQGSDLQMEVNLTFQEAVFGVEKTLRYNRLETCDKCEGTGAEGKKVKTCSTCNGRGQVVQAQRTMLGTMQMAQTCPTCSGFGEVPEKECSKCKGSGRTEKQTELKVKIPAGIPDGVNLRYQGKGNSGEKGGAYGDLFLVINVEDHSVLERRGNDIYMDKHISVTDAVLGAEIEVPTVHGSVIMKVPAGTQSEKILRLKEKGGPKFREKGNGDQYVRLIVDIPTKLSKEEQKIWQDLRQSQ